MEEKFKFELKKEHVKLMRKLNFRTAWYGDDDYFDQDENIRPTIDQKRPFGNSDMITDVLEIIGEERSQLSKDYPDEMVYSSEQIMLAKYLIIELPVALEIVIQYQTFTPGIYEVEKYGAFFQYTMRRNYLILLPTLEKVERELKEHPVYKNYICRLHERCMNIAFAEDPWIYIKEEWSGRNDFFDKVLDIIFGETHETKGKNNGTK